MSCLQHKKILIHESYDLTTFFTIYQKFLLNSNPVKLLVDEFPAIEQFWWACVHNFSDFTKQDNSGSWKMNFAGQKYHPKTSLNVFPGQHAQKCLQSNVLCSWFSANWGLYLICITHLQIMLWSWILHFLTLLCLDMCLLSVATAK